MHTGRALGMLCASFLSAAPLFAATPCRYSVFPAVLGAEWTMRFTNTSDHMASTMIRRERIIDVGSDSFIETIETSTEKVAGTYVPHEDAKSHEVSYRCTDRGPLQTGDLMRWESPEVPAVIEVGTKWETAYTMEQLGRVPTNYTVAGMETVTVPAGTFETYRVNYESTLNTGEKPYLITQKTTGTKWYAPNVGLVKWDETRAHKQHHLKKNNESKITMNVELLSYKIPSETEEKALAAGPSATNDPGELQKRCSGGKLVDCSKLADLYRQGEMIPADHRLALNLYDKACTGGYLAACSDLAVYYLWGNLVEKDTARAAELFRKACDFGVPTACANLGQRYETGDGVEKDAPKAMALYKSACDSDAPAGCFHLAVATQDAALFEKACNGGHPEACSRLAALTTDPARTRQLTEAACDRGWAPDCHQLAQKSTDPLRAAAFFTVGCKYGYAASCTKLAAMVEKGRGVRKDVSFAVKLYQQACQWKDNEACAALARLK